MNFQNLKHVEEYQFYLDLALRRSREKGTQLRQAKLKGGRLEKSTYIETMKIQVAADTVISRMQAIIRSFPSINQLPVFYLELLKLHIDYAQLKQSLGAVDWVARKVKDLQSITLSSLRRNKQFDRINIIKREFLGRLSSLVKQIRHDFVFLEQSRRTLKAFPTVATGLRTVALAGFPNVGKTTLLSRLTGSTAEIQDYAFTTKGINVGSLGKGKDALQFLDTPGTLNRFEKMNFIEKTAFLALRHCAHLIVYVFDPTDTYPMDQQEKLYTLLRKEFRKPLLCYVSKTDVAEKKRVEEIVRKHGALTGIPELKRAILEKIPPLPEEPEQAKQPEQGREREEA